MSRMASWIWPTLEGRAWRERSAPEVRFPCRTSGGSRKWPKRWHPRCG
ncbi:hypothetical protein MINT15_23630 [Saccharomonospora viridis]|uniref:Uncharacterized protein n=1 Tax=Saccharomonospora viridis TaxID=1852 RepID=A0A837D9W0_9PSEU|nr:hypothetical protein MINT15_23630 [Saccharomonospora viridis]